MWGPDQSVVQQTATKIAQALSMKFGSLTSLWLPEWIGVHAQLEMSTYLAQLPWIPLIANIRGQRHCIQVVQRSSKFMWVKLAQWAQDLHFIKPSTCVVDPYAFDTFSFQERSGNSVFNPPYLGHGSLFYISLVGHQRHPSCLKTFEICHWQRAKKLYFS